MDTEALYDEDASRWRRDTPSSLSDYTGRPAVFALCGEDLTGQSVVDLGCGEGYCTRELKRRGAREVLGIERSTEMLEIARQQERATPLGIEYAIGDVTALDLAAESYDLVAAVFVFHYLDCAGMQVALTAIRRLLRPGGAFVFAVPHPSFALLWTGEKPFRFQVGEMGYFSGRDTRHDGQIWCRDGESLRVQMIHKPLEEYFDALRTAGFESMPTVRELRVQDEHLRLDPDFFGPIRDVPLHLAMRVEVP